MDTYSFHFERMSNVDLHPLSLPISRLSPAKSNSSIVDQLAHHQHGKGDSAYSSFSGGSTAPDYPSPFIPDDLQSSSFSHYGDLKYVKSVYHPTHVLQSDSKTMDQLRRSVEAISHQYHTNTSITVNNYNHNDSNNFHTNNKAVSKQEVILGAPSQSAYPHGCPPPVPARLDSFIATKNLENSRVHHHSPQFQPHHLQPQKQPRHYPQLSPPPHDLNSPVTEMVNPDTGDSRSNSDVYSVWRCSQQHQPQPQQPSSWRPPLQLHDQTKVPLTAEYLFIVDNKTVSEQQKSTNILNRSPPQGTSQHEDLKPKQPCGGFTEDNHNKTSGSSSHFESQSKRSHSSHDWLVSDPSQDTSKWNAVQGFLNGSIQHKGQFYFVTGVCKPTESGWRTHSGSMSETGSESTTVLEKYQLREREKERTHSTMENLFRPLQQSSCTFTGTVPDRRESFTSVSKGKDQSSRTQDQENHRPTLISKQSSRSFDALEEIGMMQSFEISRHTASNPIFYCGPDRNYPPHSTMQAKEVTTLLSNEQPNNCQRGKQQPLGDVASERINKETTPLLYHLTGANRAVLKSKKDSDFSVQEKEAVLNKTSSGDMAVKDNERPPYSDTSRNERADVISAACNTLDDSFKKYYKEKLKDAQSKVLRETSFKRRDLQLSLLHCTRQKHEPSRTAIHSFSSSQDSETSTNTLTPSVTPEETDRGSIKEEVRENPKKTDEETEKENGRPANVAQPQVSRIGGRKRLTPEQKNMCYSEPEKLNQLGGTPNHSSCRSFDDGSDNLCAVECEGEESEQQGEQGLVASRRRMFERRGRALSTSSASKTNLKHLQHKALVEYMERKTGQKVAEPQQPAPQLPPPPRQRHSLGEKPFDWIPRPLSGNHENKNMKKKFHRPHSAGRILDSSSGSVRYAQFFSAQSCSGQYAGQPNQSRWRESHGSSQGKSLSVENLLDQSEPPSFLRSRSTSIPHAFQTHDYDNDPLPVKSLETCSSPKICTEDSLAKPAPKGQQLVRMVAQRGKSMEELGASKSTRPSALSKSSEQLDQLWRNSTEAGGPDRDLSFISEVRQAQGQERGRKKHHLTEENRQEPLAGGQKSTQGQMQHQTQKKSPVKQNSGEDVTAGTRNSSRSTSPSSCSSSLARFHPGSHGPATATDKMTSSISPNETSSDPSSPRSLETLSSPTHTKLSCENRPCFRFETCPSVTASEREQSVDEPSNDTLPHEVSLSCGVTTDPSLWILPPEEIKEEVQASLLTDSGCDDEPTISAPQMQTSKTSVSPCTSVSDADISQQVEEEKNPETEDEKRGENQGIKERGAPEGETESMERPGERPQWEELVEAVVKADQSLVTVLYPLANRKTALMLMEQLLSEDTLLMEEHYKKKQEQRGASESVEKGKGDESSACPSHDSLKPQCTDLQGKTEITEKKHLLVSYIKEHLHSLEERRGALQTEIQENVARGQALEMLVRDRCLPVELERYNLFIGDLEKVVSLLLCLSARLARVQNALSTVDQNTDVEEKQSLDSRHRLLCKQREDAKDLKDNLDRRENLVSTFLSRQLTAEQLQDYRRFVQTKASLLIQQKDLEEKLKLGEEQLEALSNNLNL